MLANQSKNDTLYIKGFNIIVENRAFTYRQVAQNVGQKACLMPAHYGYLQNNPKVGVFVGAFPENDTVYLINQKAQGGYFDKHIAMFGFLSEEQAVDTYQKCFEYGYIGLMSVIPCTIEQLKWWLINGDKSRPVTKERLPYAGLERLDSVLWGGEDQADLASHSGQVAKLLYQIRQSDNFNHALEPLSYHDLTQELGNQGFVYENYDALVIEYNKRERKAKQMLMAMQGAADIVKPVGVAVSKPLTKNGVANVVAWFEMDDGQAVGVFFHNPDKTPKKIDPTDEMISYKWVLNKKDITIVVAPENGKDLVIRTVAKRIMKLVDANHDRFLKANSDKAELNLKEQNLGQLVIEKQAELDALNKDIEALEAQKAEREANKLKVPTGEELRQQGYNGVISELKKLGWTDDSVTGGLSKSFIGANEKGTINPNGILNVIVTAKDANMMATVGGDTIVSGSTVIIPQYGVTAQTEESYKKVADKINNAVEAYVAKRREEIQSSALKTTGKLSTPQELVQAADVAPIEENLTPTQERPADYRTNLANARAVAKSLGIETKGKKLNTLLKEIDVFDENEVKKELLAEFKVLASRLVLPKGYVFDLTDAEKAIDNVWHSGVSPMIRQKGSDTDLNKIRIELRTIPDSSQDVIFNSVHFYTDDKNTKKELDKLNYQNFDPIGRSEAITPKAIVEKMEQFLTKAVFPKIEYLKVVNSTNVDVSKLSEIGIAEITDIGDENLYFEKDGKYYISKVGNPQLYALGKWDFAKYPDGVVSQATEPKQPESEPSMANPDRDLLDFALVTFSSWKKNGKHRIYLKLSEKDNAFNKMDYGVNDLGYLEIKGKDIKNLSTVSSYSPLSDRIIGDEFIVSFKKYLSEKDMNIADFSIKTLPVSIKSDAEVLTEKQAAINARTQAESQAAQAQQSKVDLQQATIKENIIKFGKDAVANDLSDAVLGNKAKVDAILGGALMSDKDFNSFLSYQASAKPIAAQNPDRDYLQSIIDGKDTGLEPKAITAKIRQIIVKAKDENDTEILVLADQAAKAYAAQVKAKAAAKLAEVQ